MRFKWVVSIGVVSTLCFIVRVIRVTGLALIRVSLLKDVFVDDNVDKGTFLLSTGMLVSPALSACCLSSVISVFLSHPTCQSVRGSMQCQLFQCLTEIHKCLIWSYALLIEQRGNCCVLDTHVANTDNLRLWLDALTLVVSAASATKGSSQGSLSYDVS